MSSTRPKVMYSLDELNYLTPYQFWNMLSKRAPDIQFRGIAQMITTKCFPHLSDDVEYKLLMSIPIMFNKLMSSHHQGKCDFTIARDVAGVFNIKTNKDLVPFEATLIVLIYMNKEFLASHLPDCEKLFYNNLESFQAMYADIAMPDVELYFAFANFIRSSIALSKYPIRKRHITLASLVSEGFDFGQRRHPRNSNRIKNGIFEREKFNLGGGYSGKDDTLWMELLWDAMADPSQEDGLEDGDDAIAESDQGFLSTGTTPELTELFQTFGGLSPTLLPDNQSLRGVSVPEPSQSQFVISDPSSTATNSTSTANDVDLGLESRHCDHLSFERGIDHLDTMQTRRQAGHQLVPALPLDIAPASISSSWPFRPETSSHQELPSTKSSTQSLSDEHMPVPCYFCEKYIAMIGDLQLRLHIATNQLQVVDESYEGGRRKTPRGSSPESPRKSSTRVHEDSMSEV